MTDGRNVSFSTLLSSLVGIVLIVALVHDLTVEGFLASLAKSETPGGVAARVAPVGKLTLVSETPPRLVATTPVEVAQKIAEPNNQADSALATPMPAPAVMAQGTRDQAAPTSASGASCCALSAEGEADNCHSGLFHFAVPGQ